MTDPLDTLSGILGKVNRANSMTHSTIDTVKGAKKTVIDVKKEVGDALKKKCKLCGAPLNTDLEKEKGICANCALKQLQ